MSEPELAFGFGLAFGNGGVAFGAGTGLTRVVGAGTVEVSGGNGGARLIGSGAGSGFGDGAGFGSDFRGFSSGTTISIAIGGLVSIFGGSNKIGNPK